MFQAEPQQGPNGELVAPPPSLLEHLLPELIQFFEHGEAKIRLVCLNMLRAFFAPAQCMPAGVHYLKYHFMPGQSQVCLTLVCTLACAARTHVFPGPMRWHV